MILVANPPPFDVFAILQTRIHHHFRLDTVEENQLIGRFSCVIDIKTNLDFDAMAEFPNRESLVKEATKETVAGRLNVPENTVEVELVNGSTLHIGIIANAGTNIDTLKSHASAVAEDLSSNVVADFAAIVPKINDLSLGGAFAVTDISISIALNKTKGHTKIKNNIDRYMTAANATSMNEQAMTINTISNGAEQDNIIKSDTVENISSGATRNATIEAVSNRASTDLTKDTSPTAVARDSVMPAAFLPKPWLGIIGDTQMPETDRSKLVIDMIINLDVGALMKTVGMEELIKETVKETLARKLNLPGGSIEVELYKGSMRIQMYPTAACSIDSLKLVTNNVTDLTLSVSESLVAFVPGINEFVMGSSLEINHMTSDIKLGMPVGADILKPAELHTMKKSMGINNQEPVGDPIPYQERISGPFAHMMPVHELTPSIMAFMAAILFFPSLMLLII